MKGLKQIRGYTFLINPKQPFLRHAKLNFLNDKTLIKKETGSMKYVTFFFTNINFLKFKLEFLIEI